VSGHHHGDAGRVEVHVLVASSTRGPGDDGSGVVVGERLAAAGHTVGSREVVDDDVQQLREHVKRLVARGVAAIVITGGTGLSPRDVTPEAVEPLFSRRLEGFGELFRSLSFAEIGPDAMLSRATAGVVGRTAVFAIPGSPAACVLAVDRLIAPTLGHLVGQLEKPEPPPRMPGEVTEEVELEPVAPNPGAEQPPSARTIGRAGVAVKHKEEDAKAPVGEEGPWQRRIRELGGTIHRGEHEPFPEEVERLAPLVDLLVTAGDVAVLELSHGRRYSLWGFPDLRRSGSKVLALGPGWPLCELVPLHRTGTGVSIDGPTGLVTGRSASVAATAELLVGRAPPSPEGAVFAVTGDTLFVERDGKVYSWDGHKEHALGTPKQALASLALEWSRR
jgi:molybdenum cofactor biosynthesis protein B